MGTRRGRSRASGRSRRGHGPKEVISWADLDDNRSLAVACHWGFQRRPGSVEGPDDLEDGEAWAWNYSLYLNSTELGRITDLAPLPVDVEIRDLADVVERVPDVRPGSVRLDDRSEVAGRAGAFNVGGLLEFN